MITPEQFASIEVGDTVTVRQEVTAEVVVKSDTGFGLRGQMFPLHREGNRDLVEHTKPTPEWHRAKVIGATVTSVAGETLRDIWVMRRGAFRNGTYSFYPADFYRLSDVRVLVGEGEEL